MSAGAAMIGSAFGPANPFQAAIALKLAELPTATAFGLRMLLFAAAVIAWIAWTMRYAASHRGAAEQVEGGERVRLTARDALIMTAVLAPIAAYVYGSLSLGWGFNELAAAFVIGAAFAGLLGGLGVSGTAVAFLEGTQSMLPAALLIGVARSISLVLTDGHVVDTILNALAAPLSRAPAATAAFLMVPVHALIHIVVPSVSGQAVLTMPLFVPLADLLSLSRLAPVLAYTTGGGLMELFTPTNGALMAVLLAAGVPLGRWLRFAVVATAVPLVIGLCGIAAAMWMAP
jgi:uncharacterized ion transporter superfamily protein YfcC